jgi:hypothetical protein
LTSNFELKLSYQRKGGQFFFMKENPIIVPVQLDQSNLVEAHRTKTQGSIPSCQLKMNGAEATFYNGVDKHILHAVLAEMSKHAR